MAKVGLGWVDDSGIIYTMEIRENIPLAELTTMRLGGAA